jgi:DNA-binding transcriptional LysR family regulator
MRLEWIEDILAVLKTGSFKQAAEQRFLSQSAFSRRIKAIEEYIGVSLIDRSRKPAQINGALHDEQHRLEELAAEIRSVLYELRQNDKRARRRLVIAGQHAAIIAVAPEIIKLITDISDVEIVLKSANREECFFSIATNQADLALVYKYKNEEMPLKKSLIEQIEIGIDDIIPVFQKVGGKYIRKVANNGDVPIIVYPPDVFFGQVMSRQIYPYVSNEINLRRRAETALTLAALQLALEGVGVGWIPRSLAANELARETLEDLSSTLVSTDLTLTALCIHGRQSSDIADVWEILMKNCNRLSRYLVCRR